MKRSELKKLISMVMESMESQLPTSETIKTEQSDLPVSEFKNSKLTLNEVGVDTVFFTLFIPGKVNGELLNKKMPNIDFLQAETDDLKAIINKYPSLGVDDIDDEVYTVLQKMKADKENGELRTGKNRVYFYVNEDNKLAATTVEMLAKESNKEASARKSSAADDDEPKSVAVPEKPDFDDEEDESWAAEKELGYDFDKERAYKGSGDLWESLPPWTVIRLKEALRNNIKKVLKEVGNICPTCHGSGEGRWENSKCRDCKGSGEANYKKPLTKNTDPDYDWDGEREEKELTKENCSCCPKCKCKDKTVNKSKKSVIYGCKNCKYEWTEDINESLKKFIKSVLKESQFARENPELSWKNYKGDYKTFPPSGIKSMSDYDIWLKNIKPSKCPKCKSGEYSVLNPSHPSVHQCKKCQHKWNPDYEKNEGLGYSHGSVERNPEKSPVTENIRRKKMIDLEKKGKLLVNEIKKQLKKEFGK